MAPKAKPAAETEKKAPPTSQEIMGQFLEETKKEHFAFIKPKHIPISTGSLTLDSIVTLRSGGVLRLTGKGAELGKTSEAFVVADEYMRTMPKAKTIYYKAEARLTPEIMARSGLRFVFTAEEWVEGTVFVFPVNIFEVFAENLEKVVPVMYEAGESLCVILDSMDGLMLRADRVKKIWADAKGGDPKVAGVPKLTKELFRRLGLMITHYDVFVAITGQYSAAIQLDQYAAKEVRQADSSGGNSVAHQSDNVFEYMPRYQKDYILEKPEEQPDYRTNKVLGVYATILIKKSATDMTGTRVRIPIKKGRKGSAIWIEREIIDLMLGWEMLAKARNKEGKRNEGGSWLEFEDSILEEITKETGVTLTKKINGLNNAYAELEAQPLVVAYLFKKFRELIAASAV